MIRCRKWELGYAKDCIAVGEVSDAMGRKWMESQRQSRCVVFMVVFDRSDDLATCQAASLVMV